MRLKQGRKMLLSVIKSNMALIIEINIKPTHYILRHHIKTVVTHSTHINHLEMEQ